MAARRAAELCRHRPGNSGDAGLVDRRRRAVRIISIRIRLHLRYLLRRARVGDGRARVSLRDRLDFRLWRRVELGDPQVSPGTLMPLFQQFRAEARASAARRRK